MSDIDMLDIDMSDIDDRSLVNKAGLGVRKDISIK